MNLGKTDSLAEQEGVWIDYSYRVPGVKLKIARDGNPRHKEWLEKELRPFFRQFRDGYIPASIRDPIALRALAKYILLDWQGVTTDDDPPTAVPYSETAAYAALKESTDFRNDVEFHSLQAANYKREQDEVEHENLSSTSAGS